MKFLIILTIAFGLLMYGTSTWYVYSNYPEDPASYCTRYSDQSWWEQKRFACEKGKELYKYLTWITREEPADPWFYTRTRGGPCK